MKAPNSTALIADVKGSRQIENWPEVFALLKKTLSDANRRFKDDILVKFAPTVGDEFQGALKSPDRAYEAYTFIKASLPVPIYCGFGIGEVEITAKSGAGLRGTAFYRAREALELCKQAEGFLRVRFGENSARAERIANGFMRLTESLEKQWTDRQRQVANFCRLHPDLTHQQIASHLQISRATVTQILSAAQWDVIARTDDLIKELLGEESFAQD